MHLREKKKRKANVNITWKSLDALDVSYIYIYIHIYIIYICTKKHISHPNHPNPRTRSSSSKSSIWWRDSDRTSFVSDWNCQGGASLHFKMVWKRATYLYIFTYLAPCSHWSLQTINRFVLDSNDSIQFLQMFFILTTTAWRLPVNNKGSVWHKADHSASRDERAYGRPWDPWGGSDRYQLQWSGQVQLMKVKVNQLSYSQLVLLIKGATSVSTIPTKIIDTKPMGLVLWDILGGCLATNCCNLGHRACSIASTALGEPNFTSTALGPRGTAGFEPCH